MLTAIAALIIAPLATVDIYPTDDIWAYPHAGDPSQDAYLRVWGFEGESVAKTAAESESLGYSFLRFDLSGLPSKPLKGAELILTHGPKPSFTLELAKQHPLEARPVPAGFTEKTWTYNDLAKFMPTAGKAAVYGAGSPTEVSADKDFQIRIDLLKGEGNFAAAFDKAYAGKAPLALALTSTMSPAEESRSTYKVYSKDGPKESRPVLRLTFAD